MQFSGSIAFVTIYQAVHITICVLFGMYVTTKSKLKKKQQQQQEGPNPSHPLAKRNIVASKIFSSGFSFLNLRLQWALGRAQEPM